MVFIEIKKAYDKVPREVKWWVLKKKGVSLKFIKLIKDRISGGNISEFPITIGLHQGLALKSISLCTSDG